VTFSSRGQKANENVKLKNPSLKKLKDDKKLAVVFPVVN
jgi:hypothetical protein